MTNLGVPYRGSAVALQADGKIVVAGSTGAAPERNFTLARFNGDGTLDASFGTGGVVTTDLGEDDTAADVIVQADGKIVVAGGSGRLALARYLSNGSLDPTFGSSGTVTTNLPEGGHGRAVALQADGKIVVVGYTTGIISPAFVLARYGENGSLDPTFGSSGVAVTDCAGISSDVAIQADGKIVVAGYDANGGTFSFILARYQPEGGPDLAFDGDGVADTEVGTGWADYSDTAVAIQPDGKIVAAGGGYTGFSLARYESNGSLDPAFGVDGIVITDSGPFGWSWCTDLFIEPNGRIVAGGPVGLLSQFDFGLARYLHTGELDSRFGSGGTVVTDLGDNESGSVGIALQADGKLVAAGASGSSLALARYLGADGAEMYYAQLPDPNGWDVRYPGGWSILGDDWQADQTGPVNEIRLWLSWREDNTSSLGQVGIGIWSDQPGSPAKPGQVLWNKTFNPGDYVLTLYGSGDQGFYDPSLTSPIVLPHDHWNYHEVTIPNIPDPFVQQEGEIYWLVTFVYPDMAWHGWKTTEGSFLASAVQRVSGDWSPLTDPLSGKALDLSFVIGSDAVPACPATIRAIRSGNWSDANIWDLQRVPGHNDLVQIGSGHTVVVPDQVQIRGLCNYGSLQSWGNHRLSILASGSVANYGEILGSAGRAGGGTECGQAGSSIEIEGSPIYNEGTIRAGAGGTGDQCGGPGGSTMVLGRNTTNEGTICGGKGGDAVGTTANAQGGAGGETHVWGKWGGAGAFSDGKLILSPEV
ncbi:MAG: hypothetical protein ACK2U9_09255, partial [Anaerolineae bacterium]